MSNRPGMCRCGHHQDGHANARCYFRPRGNGTSCECPGFREDRRLRRGNRLRLMGSCEGREVAFLRFGTTYGPDANGIYCWQEIVYLQDPTHGEVTLPVMYLEGARAVT